MRHTIYLFKKYHSRMIKDDQRNSKVAIICTQGWKEIKHLSGGEGTGWVAESIKMSI